MRFSFYAILFLLAFPSLFFGQEKQPLQLLDVFELEYASDPQVSPDGRYVVYVRNFKDIMTDGNRSNLWLLDLEADTHRPLTSGMFNDNGPRWSPSGDRIAYLSTRSGKTQIHIHWMENGQHAQITHLQNSPGQLAWSPDGKHLSFVSFVPEPGPSLGNMPAKPAGAKWAKSPVYVEDINYRADGAGYLPSGSQHFFLISVEGGTPRQLTSGDYAGSRDYCWTPDGEYLLFSANFNEDAEGNPANSEIYELEIATGEVKALTDREGPDASPRISPDGKTIAFLGYDEKYLGYQQQKLYMMERNGKKVQEIETRLDRSPGNISWAPDGSGVYFQYDDEGDTKLSHITPKGKLALIAKSLGGMSLGRPYDGADYGVGGNGIVAFTLSGSDHPADIATVQKGNSEVTRRTSLNEDLFSQRQLGEVEELWFSSSFDDRRVQGWIVYPPDFDKKKKYPLLLEIHGGPFANYGPRFAMELQLYAAAGYVVLYTNPRGSTSYGAEFGNLIHHNYPSEDYDDLMSGVDAMLAQGYIDPDSLYITGGSGGGVLTAWTIGKTNRFRAAVVAKPVINWYSFVLYADGPSFFYKYWFPGYPWENLDHYMKRSPISLVGNVNTPTMLLTGERDYRTPIAESEQYYAALKIRGIDASMVRIPEAGHGIAAKPSYLVAKVAYILGWFDKYRKP